MRFVRELDYNVSFWIQSLNTESVAGFFRLISFVFDAEILLIVGAGIAVVLFIQKKRGEAFFMGSSMIGIAVLCASFKNLVMAPRPVESMTQELGFSFPSGHIAVSLVFFGCLIKIAWDNRNNFNLKLSTAILYVGIILFVGFHKLILNHHWVSDIFGGLFLGIFWLTFVIFLFGYLKKHKKFPYCEKSLKPNL